MLFRSSQREVIRTVPTGAAWATDPPSSTRASTRATTSVIQTAPTQSARVAGECLNGYVQGGGTPIIHDRGTIYMTLRRNSPTLLTLAAACAIAFAARPLATALLRGTAGTPDLPLVYVVPWDRHHDALSSVPALWLAVGLAFTVSVVAEVAKTFCVLSQDLRLYSLALAFQLVAAAETLATCAPDWAAYVVSLVAFSGRREVWPSAMPRWPWLSLALLLVIAMSLAVRPSLTRQSGRHDGRHE